MAQVATKNIYEFLTDESHVEEAPKAATAPKTAKSTPAAKTATGNKSTKPATTNGGGKKIQASRPAPVKDGQFFEKPQHNKVGGESGVKKHHNHAKPLKGRQFDKKSSSFKKDEKVSIVDAELQKADGIEYF